MPPSIIWPSKITLFRDFTPYQADSSHLLGNYPRTVELEFRNTKKLVVYHKTFILWRNSQHVVTITRPQLVINCVTGADEFLDKILSSESAIHKWNLRDDGKYSICVDVWSKIRHREPVRLTFRGNFDREIRIRETPRRRSSTLGRSLITRILVLFSDAHVARNRTGWPAYDTDTRTP